MNIEHFIAKRFHTIKKGKHKVSAPIVKIAVIAISVGIVMMLITMATGIGLQRKIRDKIALFKGHIQISNYDNNLSESSTTPISSDQQFYPNHQFSNVEYIFPYATKTGIIRTSKAFEGVVFKGVDSTYNWNALSNYLTEGDLPTFGNSIGKEVLLSERLAKSLELKVGDVFDTYFLKEDPNKLPNRRKFTVCGIYNTGFEEFDNIFIFGDLRQVQRLNKWANNQVGGFELYVLDLDLLQETGQQIFDETPSNLDIRTIKDMYAAIFDWLALFDTNINTIIGIIIFVAGINMITALLVIILERTQSIGILKALGFSNWQVRKIFLYQAFYIISRGLIFGNAIGLILLYIQSRFGLIKLDPNTYYVTEAPIYINAWQILLLNAGTVFLCLTMLIIPSSIISKISPTKAIKFQ